MLRQDHATRLQAWQDDAHDLELMKITAPEVLAKTSILVENKLRLVIRTFILSSRLARRQGLAGNCTPNTVPRVIQRAG